MRYGTVGLGPTSTLKAEKFSAMMEYGAPRFFPLVTGPGSKTGSEIRSWIVNSALWTPTGLMLSFQSETVCNWWRLFRPGPSRSSDAFGDINLTAFTE